MKSSEAKHLSRVAELGCALCRRMGYGESPAQIHHPRINQAMGKKASNWLAIPLCQSHHLGEHGIHGDRADFRSASVDELDLLADTYEQLYG